MNHSQDKIIDTFSKLPAWLDKYDYLINLGKKMPAMAPELKTEDNAVSGCQSKVWIAANHWEGKVRYQADSDTLITKGLIALVLEVLNEQSREVIAKSDLYFIKKIGLQTNLSPSRANGLMSIVKQMKYLAQQL